jgi:hypothetical protein
MMNQMVPEPERSHWTYVPDITMQVLDVVSFDHLSKATERSDQEQRTYAKATEQSKGPSMCFLHLIQKMILRYAPINPSPIEVGSPKPSSVRFDCVEIREHTLILGTHPCCRDGMCLELGWKHSLESRVVSINQHEAEKSGRLPFRIKSAKERQERLKKVGGYSLRELRKAQEECLVTVDELVEQ